MVGVERWRGLGIADERAISMFSLWRREVSTGDETWFVGESRVRSLHPVLFVMCDGVWPAGVAIFMTIFSFSFLLVS